MGWSGCAANAASRRCASRWTDQGDSAHAQPSMTAGYSGTPLSRKLGITPGSCVLAIGSPSAYQAIVSDFPADVSLVSRVSSAVDLAHLFATRRAELQKQLGQLRVALRTDATIWVSWPKKTAKVATDITEDVIREVALPLGLVDVKVCAVTDIWSGLKLVVRKNLRSLSGRHSPSIGQLRCLHTW